MKKLRKFEELMNEQKAVVFNTNVLKNVKLAMKPEEIKAEEDKVFALSTYINETALENLVRNLTKQEGTPTDSSTLRDFFHSNGINMRYIGKIAEMVKDQNQTQLKYMLEREVVLRSLKHILNEYIRDSESDETLSASVCHLLNCLFAPKEFIKRLDDGTVMYIPHTLKE